MKQEVFPIAFFKGLDSRDDARDPQTLSEMVNVEVTDNGTLQLFDGAKFIRALPPDSGKIIALIDYDVEYAGPTTLAFTTTGKLFALHEYLDFDTITVPISSPLPLWVDRLTVQDQDCIVCASHPPSRIFASSNPANTFITSLGVSSPNTEWDSPTEHAVWINPTAIRRFGTRPGVPIFVGRGYRWSWYNPTTKHESSLQMLDLVPREHTSGDYTTTFIPSVAKGDPNMPFIQEIGITLNGSSEFPEPLPRPSQGLGDYTHIRFWASTDGGENWYLVPRLYDLNANPVTDEHGAIPLDLPIRTLTATDKDPFLYYPIDPNAPTLLLDGWRRTAGPGWMVNETETGLLPTGKGGTHLILKGGEHPLPLAASPYTHGDIFTLPDSDVVIRVIGYGVEPTEIILDKRLDEIFPGGVEGKDSALLQFTSIDPVSDNELLASLVWLDGEEGHNPPPKKPSWGAVFGQRLWFSEGRRLYYSIPGQYDDFPSENYLEFQDEIVGLAPAQMIGAVSEGLNQRLLVGTKRNIQQIILLAQSGYSFVLRPFLSSTGIFGPRTWTVVSGVLFGLTGRGIEALDEQRQQWIGRTVTNIIPDATEGLHSPFTQPILCSGEAKGLVCAYKSGENQWPGVFDGPDTLMLVRFQGKESPPLFTLFQGDMLSGRGTVSALYLSHTEDKPSLLAAYGNGTIWRLFDQNPVYGYPSLDAESMTPARGLVRSQLLNFGSPGLTKIFYEVWAEDDILMSVGPQIRFSVDRGHVWTNWFPIGSKHPIGLIGDTLLFELWFTPLTTAEHKLKSLIFTYAIAGRGQSRYVWRKK